MLVEMQFEQHQCQFSCWD